MGKLYVSLQLYGCAILWRYLWRNVSYHGNEQRPQKRPLNFSFCKLSEKLIRWPTIFIGLCWKDRQSMEKRYLVEFNIFKENAFYGLQEILLDNFLRNFYIWSAIVNGPCMQTNIICRFYFRFARFYTRFYFRCANFDSFSWACVCARLQLKTLSSLLRWFLSIASVRVLAVHDFCAQMSAFTYTT